MMLEANKMKDDGTGTKGGYCTTGSYDLDSTM